MNSNHSNIRPNNKLNTFYSSVDRLGAALLQKLDIKPEVAQSRADSVSAAKKINATFANVYGCQPAVGVAADTKMFEDFGQALYNGLRDEDMTCIFPDAIKSIVARDANFEFSTSVFLPPLHLSWSYNVSAET